MRAPEKAVILAAGFGTRMIPLSLNTPKTMMPLWGKPILAHIFETVQRWGVKAVLINLHHQPDPIIRYLCETGSAKLRVNLSFEPEILGTGGVLRRAQWFLDQSPFWMINADVVCDVSPKPLLKAFSSGRSLAVLWLHEAAGPRTVDMTGGRITRFQSRRPGTKDTYTFCGLQLLSPGILSYIPEKGFSTITQAYALSMADGHRITGICVPDSFWADIGTPEAYLSAHEAVFNRFLNKQPGESLFDPGQLRRMDELRKKEVRVTGFVSQGTGVIVKKGATISNSVIWDGANIASDAVVENAIIGTQAQVHGRVPRIAMRSNFSLSSESQPADVTLAIALNKLHWNPAATTIIPFEPRGSARVFARLEYEDQRVIMIRYSLEREENALYTGHARFLKGAGWPVPSIILDVPEKQFAVVEDLGDHSLQRMVETTPLSRVVRAYQMVIKAVARLHKQATRKAQRVQLPMAPAFSADLYRWEREFFSNHFLERHLNISAAERADILDELSDVASQLLQTRAVLIHRDLQSSNILLVKGRPYFIDFQGMRFGPAAYDLASLLCDPYAELPIRIQKQLLRLYNEKVSARERISEKIFWLAAIERLAQALGAYARLSANADTEWFRKYIPPGLRMMLLALQQVDQCRRLRTVIHNALLLSQERWKRKPGMSLAETQSLPRGQ